LTRASIIFARRLDGRVKPGHDAEFFALLSATNTPYIINAIPEGFRMIHVCSLARLHDTVAETRASHIVTLLRLIDRVQRPPAIAEANHLILGMDDISMPMDGYTHPAEEHVHHLIGFVRRWDRSAPVVMHCYAGISRSTAGAFIAACALNPSRDEASVARAIRASSRTASPNIMLVGHADRILGRHGRMVAAVEALGPGAPSLEGEPFRLDLE
jgi:predicted protein tyrosine phosphatase